MSHPNLIADAADALEFVFGGRARFTLVSKETGNRKTFKVSKAKEGDDMFFASLLTGPSNENDYQYIGFIKRPKLGLIAGKKGQPSHPAFVALDWTMRHLETGHMPEKLEFWHEGCCARCGRALTDPASIERGFGPECARKAH
jgi:hypothetical protein